MENKPAMALIDAPVTPQQQAQPNPKHRVCNIPFEFVNDEELAAIESAMVQAHSTHAEQLLPGIPNEITLDHITLKLPWRDIVSLSSVSRCWNHVIRSRQVYDLRVRSHSTGTFVLLNLYCKENSSFISLYSMRENNCWTLTIPHLDGGIAKGCQCVMLDGKLYVLGGWVLAFREVGDPLRFGSRAVHVLDLAGQGLWRNCAGMRKGRAQFGCGILDGKIYVFGGKIDNERVVHDSEVYDPKNDVWSPIAPMKSDRVVHRVATVGEELVVHFGYDWTVMPMVEDPFGYFSYGGWNPLLRTHSLRFYNPIKDEWRDLQYECMCRRASFIAQGKLFSLTPEAIFIHEVAAEAWIELWQSCSFVKIGRAVSADIGVVPWAVVAVDDELLALVHLFRAYPKPFSHLTVFQSKGFSKDNQEIVWHQSHGILNTQDHHFMFPIQL